MFRSTRSLIIALQRAKDCHLHTCDQRLSKVAEYESPITDDYKKGPSEGRALYLDAQATTPLDPRVLDKMMPYLTVYHGNPHSRTHMYGWESEAAVEHARQQVADLIGADKKEVIFTSGATECNNISVKGVARFYKSKKTHIVTTQTEHKCVLDSCRALEAEGFDVTYISVKSNGLIDLNELEAAIRPSTSLVSVMMVNNEIGVKQPIEEIGIGALYVRRRPRVRVEALQSGGGQERGMRSGTVPAPLAVGLGAACELAQTEMDYDHRYINTLSNHLIEKITSNLRQVVRNGDPIAWYPGCVNLSFACVEGESLLMALKDVALSSGSACTSASLEPSYVLRAIGASEDLAHSSIRFGIGRFTTFEEVDYTADNTIQHVKRLREMR
ncbi:NFS1 protein, partial [Acromyrmex heyeri]